LLLLLLLESNKVEMALLVSKERLLLLQLLIQQFLWESLVDSVHLIELHYNLFVVWCGASAYFLWVETSGYSKNTFADRGCQGRVYTLIN
jgi:hypothetical protein